MTLDALRSLQEEVDRPNDFSAKHIAAADLLYYTLSAHLLPLAEALEAEECRHENSQAGIRHNGECLFGVALKCLEPCPRCKALKNLQEALESQR